MTTRSSPYVTLFIISGIHFVKIDKSSDILEKMRVITLLNNITNKNLFKSKFEKCKCFSNFNDFIFVIIFSTLYVFSLKEIYVILTFFIIL